LAIQNTLPPPHVKNIEINFNFFFLFGSFID